VFKKKLSFILLLVIPLFGQAHSSNPNTYSNSFYVGLMSGYGSTTWEGLVATAEHQNIAISMSTPISIKEGGTTWGLFSGYEFTPFFAVEGNYMHYPKAKVFFDPMSLFSFNNNQQTEFTTKTETVNLMAKIMLQIPNTKIRAFSNAGVAGVHRQDILDNEWHPGPTFGIGFNYHFNERLMGELNGNYTAGFGESQLDPSQSYIPFLYSLTVRLAYMF
jgi:hypothetical protein